MLNVIHVSPLHLARAIDSAAVFAQFLKVVTSAILIDQAEAKAAVCDSQQPTLLKVEPKFVSPELDPQDAGIGSILLDANIFSDGTENVAPIIRVRNTQPIKFDAVRANAFLASIPWMGSIPVAVAQAPSQPIPGQEAIRFEVSGFLAAAYFSAMPWDTAHPQRIQVGSSSGQSYARLSAGRDTSIGQTATLQAIRASRGTPTHSAEFFSAVPWMKSPSPQIGATA